MQLHNNGEVQQEIFFKASLLLIGIALHALEFFIPRIPLFPWLKIGLANSITLIWIIQFGFIESLLYVLLRIWIVSFYFGFSFLTFSLSFSGAVCACAAMSLCWGLLGRRYLMGAVGIAIIGALFHNLGQLFAVYLLMAQNTRLFYQLPVMLVASVFFGGVVGLIALVIMRVIAQENFFQRAEKAVRSIDAVPLSLLHLILSLSFLSLCMALVFVSQVVILIIVAVFVTFFVQGMLRGSRHAILYPIKRFWLLFLFIGIMHAFFTYGTNVVFFPFITYEGIHQTMVQWLKLWAWLETTFVFLHFRFHTTLLQGLQKVFTGNNSTLCAGLLAVEYFPSVIELAQHRARHLLALLFHKPSQAVAELFNSVIDVVTSDYK